MPFKCNKTNFTFQKAREALKKRIKKNKGEVRMYFCVPCQAYHLTSKEFHIPAAIRIQLNHQQQRIEQLEDELESLRKYESDRDLYIKVQEEAKEFKKQRNKYRKELDALRKEFSNLVKPINSEPIDLSK